MRTRKSTACLRCGNQPSGICTSLATNRWSWGGNLQEMLTSTFHVLQTVSWESSSYPGLLTSFPSALFSLEYYYYYLFELSSLLSIGILSHVDVVILGHTQESSCCSPHMSIWTWTSFLSGWEKTGWSWFSCAEEQRQFSTVCFKYLNR